MVAVNATGEQPTPEQAKTEPCFINPNPHSVGVYDANRRTINVVPFVWESRKGGGEGITRVYGEHYAKFAGERMPLSPFRDSVAAVQAEPVEPVADPTVVATESISGADAGAGRQDGSGDAPDGAAPADGAPTETTGAATDDAPVDADDEPQTPDVTPEDADDDDGSPAPQVKSGADLEAGSGKTEDVATPSEKPKARRRAAATRRTQQRTNRGE